MAVSFTPFQPTLGIVDGDLRLVGLLVHENPFHEAPNEQVQRRTDDFLHATGFSTHIL